MLLSLVWFLPLFQGSSFSAVPGYRNAVFPWAASNNGEAFYPQSDQAALTFPLQSALSFAVKTGTIPLWNPESFGGQPLFSDGSSAFAYPPKLIAADTVSPAAAHDLLSLSDVMLAGIFTYWLLIDLEISPLAALLGAVAWMFGSFTLAWLQLEVVAPLFAWFPAGLVTMRRAVNRSWLWAAIAGLCIAMLLVSTHLLFADICMVAICGYGGCLAIGYLVSKWRTGERLRAFAASLRGMGAAVLGIGIAGVVLVPTADSLKDISREPLTFAQITKNFILSPPDLKFIVLPPALPITDPKMEWGMAFVGTLTAGFAAIGLCLRRKGSGLGRGLVLGSLLVAFGGPVSWLAYRVIPGMNVFRPYSRLLFVFDMGMAVAGAVGLDAAMSAMAGRNQTRSLSGGRHTLGARPRYTGRWWISRVFALVVVAITALQLGVYGRQINPPFLPAKSNVTLSEAPLISALKSGDRGVAGWPNRVLPANDSLSGWQPPMLDSNVAMVFGLSSASGYDSSVPTRTVDVWRVVSGEDPDEVIGTKLPGAFQPTFEAETVRFQMLPRLGVNQIALTPAAAGDPAVTERLDSLGWDRIYSGNGGSVYEWVGPATGPVVVFNSHYVTSDGAALRAFADPEFDYRTDVILEGSRAGQTTSPGSATVVSAREDTNSALIRTEASGPGVLVVPEMWDRGWSATVNGAAVPVLRANFNEQAVRIPAGAAVVQLTYRPLGLTTGLIITSVSLAVCLGIFVWCLLRAIRNRRRSNESTNWPV